MSASPTSGLRAFVGRYVISLGVVAALTVTGVAVVNHGIDSRVDKIDRVKLLLAAAPPQGANYLIIGSDTRRFAGETGDVQGFGDPNTNPGANGVNSDTLMVAHVEPDAQRTVVVSFPRDLWVTIPGQSGKHKINSAYGLGGPQAVIDTLAANFDIPIQHYIEVDFRTFQGIVDAIGQVKVSFPYPARDQQTGLNALVAGCYPLDGAAALAYVRSRYLEYYIDGHWQYVGQDAPDLHRIARQQAFIRKLAGIAIQRSLGDPLLALKISDEVLQYIKADTGLTRDNVNELIRAFKTANVNDQSQLQFETVPTEPATAPDGESILDLGAGADLMIAQLRTFGNNTPRPPTVLPSQVTVRVFDGTTKPQAQDTASKLTAQGFHAGFTDATPPTVPTTAAPSTSASTTRPTSTSTGSSTSTSPRATDGITTTEIRYAPDQVEEAKALLTYVADAKLVPDPSAKGHLDLVLGDSFVGITVPPTTTTLPGTPTTTALATTAPTTATTTVPPNEDCS